MPALSVPIKPPGFRRGKPFSHIWEIFSGSPDAVFCR
jgi:hypothetical protein